MSFILELKPKTRLLLGVLMLLLGIGYVALIQIDALSGFFNGFIGGILIGGGIGLLVTYNKT